MEREVAMEWRVWVYVWEATFLVLWTLHSYRKYKELRAESMLL